MRTTKQNDKIVSSSEKYRLKKLENEMKKLKKDLKPYFQSQCEHVFQDIDNGCMESLFCTKCGMQNPDWVEVGSSYYLYDSKLQFSEKVSWVSERPDSFRGMGYVRKEVYEKAVEEWAETKKKEKKKGK